MHPRIAIENIEELRRREGIEDAELARQVRALAAGDIVRLTFLAGRSSPGEVLCVRITSMSGDSFRGKLLADPASASLAELRAGAAVTFTIANIHSVARHG